MNEQKKINKRRLRRRRHVRKRVRGSADRPRMCVHRSLKHIGCQLIDDAAGTTVVSASTRDKDLCDRIAYGGNKEAAQVVGRAIAEKALKAGIKEVRFDRGHCKYHGRVASLADAAREAGLVF